MNETKTESESRQLRARWTPPPQVILARPGMPLSPKKIRGPGAAKAELFYSNFRAIAQEVWGRQGTAQRAGTLVLTGESTFPAGALPQSAAAVARGKAAELLRAVLGGEPDSEFEHTSDDGHVRVRVAFVADVSAAPREEVVETRDEVGHPSTPQPVEGGDRDRVSDNETEKETATAAERRLFALADEIDRVRMGRREELRQAVGAYLRTQDPETYEEKQRVAGIVSGLLTRVGFGIRFQGRDCYLSTAPVSKTVTGRFVLLPFGSPTRLIQRTRLPELVQQLGPLELSDIASPLISASPTAGTSWTERETARSTNRRPGKEK